MDTFQLNKYLVYKKKIGKGTFSNVYKGIDTINQQEVAIKKINRNGLDKYSKYIDREISLMKNLDHKNIIKLYDVLYSSEKEKEKNIHLILEYCPNGDLSKFIDIGGVSEEIAKKFLKQISDGLKYLQENNIYHRDLKPHNILIDENNILKITDFGFAKDISSNDISETFCGSPLYMAPEILNYQKYTDQADLWSVGVILYQLLTGKTPFEGKSLSDLVKNMKEEEIRIPNYIDLTTECKNILFFLLQKNPQKRLSWSNFHNHPWFKNHYEIDKLYNQVFNNFEEKYEKKENCDSNIIIEDELIFDFEEDLHKMNEKSNSNDYIILNNQKSIIQNIVDSFGSLGSSITYFTKNI